MKHIREYKVFEKNDTEDIKKTCEEILYDLQDDKYIVKVENYLHKNNKMKSSIYYGRMENDHERINITITLPEFKKITLLQKFYKKTKENRDETISRLLDYMDQHKEWRLIFNTYDFGDGIIKNVIEVNWGDHRLSRVGNINIVFEKIDYLLTHLQQ